LINTFNAWKRSEDAGRILVVAVDGTITKQVTGLAWRHEVSAQVFEEAAVDLARALAAFAGANSGERPPRRIGFPEAEAEGRCRDSFRLRNKIGRNGTCSIRVGDGHPRSVTLPTIGVIRVHDDTRPVRWLLRPVQQVDSGLRKPTLAPRARCCSQRSSVTLTDGMSASRSLHLTSTQTGVTIPEVIEPGRDLSELTAASGSSRWRLPLMEPR